jgi:hypothetical protein
MLNFSFKLILLRQNKKEKDNGVIFIALKIVKQILFSNILKVFLK